MHRRATGSLKSGVMLADFCRAWPVQYGAALCAEVDRLRASVEELVQQSAMVSGVAHAAAAERPRRSSSRGLESETTHLTMRPAEALPDVGEPAGAEAPVRRQPRPFPVLALTPCLCCS